MDLVRIQYIRRMNTLEAALLVVRARKGWRCAVALLHAKEAALHGQCTSCSEGLRKLCARKRDREIGVDSHRPRCGWAVARGDGSYRTATGADTINEKVAH